MTLSECVYGSPPLSTLITVAPPALLSNSEWSVRFDVSLLSAVVKVGKGRRPEGLTQIDHMVRNGKPRGDQTKTTIHFSLRCEESGRDW